MIIFLIIPEYYHFKNIFVFNSNKLARVNNVYFEQRGRFLASSLKIWYFIIL